MTAGSERFIWHDLMTTARDRVLPFYRELLGWSYQPVVMGADLGTYLIVHAGDRQIGGIVALDPDAGVRSHWLGYVSVDDVDAAAAAADAAGGALRMDATDIPSVGRFAVVADPDGALVCPFRADDGRATDAPPPADGRICWNGLLTRDPDRAAEFYAAVFGWVPRLENAGAVARPGVFLADGLAIAGIMPLRDDAAPRSVWLPFVACSDLGGHVADASRLGGSVWQLPTDIPARGRVAIITDPCGALIGLLEEHLG